MALTKCKMTLASLLLLSALASCAPSASSECAGWRPITGSRASVEWLASNDAQFLRAVIAHAEFGRAQGCWE